MQPLDVAVKGKGPLGTLKRARVIQTRYGMTPDKMGRILTHFVDILGRFDCGATFPITAVAIARNDGVIDRYLEHDIEFAVHGYYHIDHSQLSLDEQLAHFVRARDLFAARGLAADGFRCPYLRWSDDTLAAATQSGFLYDGSQALAWNVVAGQATETYRHVLDFYGAVSAETYPALPRWDHGLLRIPYCLPDDEALIDRLQLPSGSGMAAPWQSILAATYAQGELFTLGLHPERIRACEGPLVATLRAARALSPRVWITRLDEVARWWQARLAANVAITAEQNGVYHVRVEGPQGTTLLARGVDCLTAVSAWDGTYVRGHGTELRLAAGVRPVIGVSSGSSQDLTSFLRQQGYIVEQATGNQSHACYLDRPTFSYEDERPLLRQIEQGNFPLVRLGRWPDGARSALVVTGDIDALTIWDYGLRFLGN